mmetsp:Transcript_39101/g.37419  ORF Transcript_39101/g.37419 Transcript_39101/m.37419 type:complete len:120 (+) Transcript_39101:468-827(+)
MRFLFILFKVVFLELIRHILNFHLRNEIRMWHRNKTILWNCLMLFILLASVPTFSYPGSELSEFYDDDHQNVHSEGENHDGNCNPSSDPLDQGWERMIAKGEEGHYQVVVHSLIEDLYA